MDFNFTQDENDLGKKLKTGYLKIYHNVFQIKLKNFKD